MSSTTKEDRAERAYEKGEWNRAASIMRTGIQRHATTNSYYAAFLLALGYAYKHRWNDRAIEFEFEIEDEKTFKIQDKDFSDFRSFINAHQEIMRVVKQELAKRKNGPQG